jgi:hypothetical protein
MKWSEYPEEMRAKLSAAAWTSWEENNQKHATGINPNAYTLGFAACAVKFRVMEPVPLITKEFLISKGYVKVIGRDIFILERPGELSDIHCNLEHGDNWIIITKEDEVVYNGLIPTESQYEVLNQLLKLHE